MAKARAKNKAKHHSFEAEKIPKEHQISPEIASERDPDWTFGVDMSASFYPPADRMNGEVDVSGKYNIEFDCEEPEADCEEGPHKHNVEVFVAASDERDQWTENEEVNIALGSDTTEAIFPTQAIEAAQQEVLEAYNEGQNIEFTGSEDEELTTTVSVDEIENKEAPDTIVLSDEQAEVTAQNEEDEEKLLELQKPDEN